MKKDLTNQTLPQFFEHCVNIFSEKVLLWEHDGQKYRGATYRGIHERVVRFAAGLIALGIKKGDRIVLLSESRNDWVVAELAILYTGAVNVPLSVRMTEPSEFIFRINHSGARMAVVSGGQAGKIKSLLKELPSLEKIIMLDRPVTALGTEFFIDEVIDHGISYLKEFQSNFEQQVAATRPDDPANISYTSGTTADPKGIILTHRNFIANVYQAYSLMDITPDFVTLLILPWDHAFAHTAGIFCFMGKGASIAAVQQGSGLMETLKNISRNIREIRPHLLYTVPAIAKNFRKNIEKGVESGGRIANLLFRAGLSVAMTYNGLGYNRGAGWKSLLKPLVLLFDHLIFRKIRAGMGGRLQFFIGGGALLDIELQRFFYSLGIPMLQGYGLTEASPLISANSLEHHKLGSSGRIVTSLELRICDDNGNELPVGEHGEIVIKGENVMAGYWNNPEATAEALREGWLHTGDMGYVDPDGYLYVLGRFKSLLIADDGEKYSPEGMEEAFVAQSEVIEQCMLYNNQDPYTILLVYPNLLKLSAYLTRYHRDDTEEEKVVHAVEKIWNDVRQYRSGGKFEGQFPQRWLPTAIGILGTGFSEENHLLNFQLKTVRGKVSEYHRDLIDFLYTPNGKNIQNPLNREKMRELLFTREKTVQE